MVRVSCAVLVFSTSASAVSLQDSDGSTPNVLDTPDQTGYDPVVTLCAHGKDSNGKKHIQPWCKDWLQCIKENSQPTMSKAAVRKAWSPADCKEFCGEWPVMTPAFLQNGTNPNRCLDSCANFQDNLSECVATVLFEPGKLRNMGAPEPGREKPAEICIEKDTRCMPDLEVRYQRCLLHKSKNRLDKDHKVPENCDMIEMDLEDCKDCPQIKDGFQSHYTAFVGGCVDQLNAYWQAVHPNAGKSAIPGATGCKVHG